MNKRRSIIYWIATVWLALGMTSTGIVQLIGMKENAEAMQQLGYPQYLSPILGISKLLGVVAILIPRYPILKEWAYAGFFFVMLGAILSNIAVGNPANHVFGPALLLILTIISWYFRPANRRITF